MPYFQVKICTKFLFNFKSLLFVFHYTYSLFGPYFFFLTNLPECMFYYYFQRKTLLTLLTLFICV